MKDRLWGHDGIRIEVPYAIAKILADETNPDHAALIDNISGALTMMMADTSPLTPSPMITIIEGVLADGSDLSLGPIVYVRKVHMIDVVDGYEQLRSEIAMNEEHTET